MNITAKLITYNRSSDLKLTLDSWFKSDLCRIPLEILDNASSDETEIMLKEAVLNYPTLQVYRHRINIGSAGNLFRAYERFESDYCWLLCDDDIIHEDRVQLLFDSLELKPDAVLVGSGGVTRSDGGFTGNVQQFIEKGGKFFFAGSFLPGLIFKRKYLQDNNTLLKCYKAAGSIYPHAPLLEEIAMSAAHIICLDEPLIERKPNDDTKFIEANWLYEGMHAGSYLTHYQDNWNNDFIECQGFHQVKHTILAILHLKAVGLLSISRAITLVVSIPGKWWWLKILLLCSIFIPQFILQLGRKLIGTSRNREQVNKSLRI